MPGYPPPFPPEPESKDEDPFADIDLDDETDEDVPLEFADGDAPEEPLLDADDEGEEEDIDLPAFAIPSPETPLFLPSDEVPRTPSTPTLNWQTEVVLLDHGLTLPAVLDPTAERTSWSVPTPPSRPDVPLRMRLGGQEVSVVVEIVPAPTSEVRIGRDILAGRFLVRC